MAKLRLPPTISITTLGSLSLPLTIVDQMGNVVVSHLALVDHSFSVYSDIHLPRFSSTYILKAMPY